MFAQITDGDIVYNFDEGILWSVLRLDDKESGGLYGEAQSCVGITPFVYANLSIFTDHTLTESPLVSWVCLCYN